MSDADMQSAPAGDETDPQAVETFIARWEKSGGSEIRARLRAIWTDPHWNRGRLAPPDTTQRTHTGRGNFLGRARRSTRPLFASVPAAGGGACVLPAPPRCRASG